MYPQNIFYMIDIACNEKCSKCSHWKNKSIKTANIKQVSKFVINILDYYNSNLESNNFIHSNVSKQKEFCIVGGEPLIYKKDILYIIDSLQCSDLRVVIITNGVNASTDFLESIVNKNVHIVFSIDTTDREFWRFVRGRDTYDLVMANFHNAREILNPYQLSVQSVLSYETKTHIKEVSKMCEKYGLYHSIQEYISDFNGSWRKLDSTTKTIYGGGGGESIII